MRYINQNDYPYVLYENDLDHPEEADRKEDTFAMSGCGLASAMIAADRLLTNYKFDIFDSVDLSYKTKANHGPGTDYTIYAPAFAEKLGLDLEFTDDPEKVLYCLRTGGAVVALSTGDFEAHTGIFCHGAHYFVLIHELRDGRIAILDPGRDPEKYKEPARKDFVQEDGDFVYAELNVILNDFNRKKCEQFGFKNIKPFACFWRKI